MELTEKNLKGFTKEVWYQKTIANNLQMLLNRSCFNIAGNEWGYAPVLPHLKLSIYNGLSRAKWRMSPCYRPFF